MELGRFPEKYLRRIARMDPDFIRDIYETTLRIHKKDNKAFGYRVFKSVSKRYQTPHFKIYLVLNYLEYLGALQIRLETPEDFKTRMKHITGITNRGMRRKYYEPCKENNPNMTYTRSYKKLLYEDLGVPTRDNMEYPV